MTALTADMDAATAAAVAWVTSGPLELCWLCGDLVHIVPDLRLDEWRWADEDGNLSACDPDLRCLESQGGAPGRLRWLAQEQDRLLKLQRTRKGEKVWPDAETERLYWAASMEYVSLKMRAEGVLATSHVHQGPLTDSRGPFPYELPEHCGWPMRLAPSGWRCRQCPLAASQLAGLDIRVRA